MTPDERVELRKLAEAATEADDGYVSYDDFIDATTPDVVLELLDEIDRLNHVVDQLYQVHARIAELRAVKTRTEWRLAGVPPILGPDPYPVTTSECDARAWLTFHTVFKRNEDARLESRTVTTSAWEAVE